MPGGMRQEIGVCKMNGAPISVLGRWRLIIYNSVNCVVPFPYRRVKHG